MRIVVLAALAAPALGAYDGLDFENGGGGDCSSHKVGGDTNATDTGEELRAAASNARRGEGPLRAERPPSVRRRSVGPLGRCQKQAG